MAQARAHSTRATSSTTRSSLASSCSTPSWQGGLGTQVCSQPSWRVCTRARFTLRVYRLGIFRFLCYYYYVLFLCCVRFCFARLFACVCCLLAMAVRLVWARSACRLRVFSRCVSLPRLPLVCVVCVCVVFFACVRVFLFRVVLCCPMAKAAR